jgi:hypothetical protein
LRGVSESGITVIVELIFGMNVLAAALCRAPSCAAPARVPVGHDEVDSDLELNLSVES